MTVGADEITAPPEVERPTGTPDVASTGFELEVGEAEDIAAALPIPGAA